MITCEDAKRAELWFNHIDAAATFVKNWSLETWNDISDTAAYLRAFFALVSSSISYIANDRTLVADSQIQAIGCLMKKTPVPNHILEGVRGTLSFQDITFEPAKKLFIIMCDYSHLCAQVAGESPQDVAVLITTASKIDRDLLSWQATLPRPWVGPTNGVVETITSGDEYASKWNASLWNYYQVCCILLHSTVLQLLADIEAPIAQAHLALVQAYHVRYSASKASLATALSQLRENMSLQLGTGTLGHSLDGTSNADHAGSLNLLIMIQVISSSTQEELLVGDWIREALQCIGQRQGIGQAFALRELMDR